MILTIDLESERPLYLQIADAIKRGIVAGALDAGDRLPAGRELAETLDVNLETVQRAYRQLADEGVVTSRVGRGTRIADDVDRARLGVSDLVDDLVTTARRLGVSRADLAAMVDERYG